MSSPEKLKQIVEAALLAAGRPLSLDQIQALFVSQAAPSKGARDEAANASIDDEQELIVSGDEPDKKQLRDVLAELTADYAGRGIEIREVGSGFRIQVRAEFAPWVSRLYTERPPRYSRALLETLALIAYRQPITRGEIEDIRGVSVSTHIIRTLTEREWVRVVGHRDVPGKPALYATTKEFLDYFNLKSLSELPTLAEIRDLESINRELELKDPDLPVEETEQPQPQAEIPEEEPTLEDEDLTDLIESDPDGETDSGVMHQEHPAVPEPTVPSVNDTGFETDPDGETDSLTNGSLLNDQPVKKSDEAE